MYKTKLKRPCVYTLEEVHKRLEEAEKCDEEGRFVTHAEMLKMIAFWRKKNYKNKLLKSRDIIRLLKM